MTHGDDNGLVLPPYIAPTQLIVIPIAAHKPGVTEKATEICEKLKAVCRVKMDDSKQSPGWKFAEYEMKGVPLRLEIGPRDIENNCCVLVRRDNNEKITVSLDELETAVPELLQKVHDGLYEKALARRESMTYDATTLDEMIDIAQNKPGLVRAMWCGDLACEEAIKEKAGLTSRCMPFEQEEIGDVCPVCGKPAKAMVYWGKQY
jgi:prolyl-tRNA synthetase